MARREATLMLHSAVALAAACVLAEKGEAGTLGLVARSLFWPEDHACTARELSHPMPDMPDFRSQEGSKR